VRPVQVNGSRHYLLAYATLAQDQHRMGGRCHLGQNAVELLHDRGAADQVAHAGLAAQTIAKGPVVQIEGAPLAGALQHCWDLLQGEGLGQVVGGAGAHRFYCRGDGGEGCHHDHHSVRVPGVDLLEQHQSAGAGQLQVQQDDVDDAARELRTGHRQRVRRLHGEAHAARDFRASVAHRLIVFDDENG
jgi:hypothetical protein